MPEAPPRFEKKSFEDQLAVAGSGADSVSLEAILAEGSKSFAAAGRLLPRRIRSAATAIYAFCRIADDAIDEAAEPVGSLEMLTDRLDRIYAGNPVAHPVDRAFFEAVTTHGIPKAIPVALFEGFEWDNRARVYETVDDTLDYCARVAATVGVMMTLLMGARRPAVVARACDLGLAMQLTNICRDVGEDADNGRIYLPRAWLAEAGVSPESLLERPRFTPALGEVVARLLRVAARHYALADIGIRALPRDARLAIRAARLIYADIGRVIATNGYDSISTRAHTGQWRKVWLCIRALGARFWRRLPNEALPHPSVRFLVAAVDRHDRARPASGAIP
jgi:phytoene synthase